MLTLVVPRCLGKLAQYNYDLNLGDWRGHIPAKMVRKKTCSEKKEHVPKKVLY